MDEQAVVDMRESAEMIIEQFRRMIDRLELAKNDPLFRCSGDFNFDNNIWQEKDGALHIGVVVGVDIHVRAIIPHEAFEKVKAE